MQLKYINTLVYLKKNQLFFILLLFWSFLWASLNSYPVEIYPLTFEQEFNIYKLFKSIFNSRIYIPLLFTSIGLIIILFKIQIFKKNYFLIIYILFFLSQLIGLALYDFENFTIERIYLVIQALNALLILYIANNILNRDQIKKFFLINIIFLVIIVIFYLPLIYIDYFNHENFYLYSSRTWSENFIDEPIIRVTGLARILSLISFIILLKLITNISNFTKLVLILLLIFIGMSFWGLQSRLAFVCFVITLLIYFILFLRKKIFINLITIFLIIFFSIAGFNYIAKYKLKSDNVVNNRILLTINALKEGHFSNNIDGIRYATSARNIIWLKIIKDYDYKKIFGYGPQADRYVILKPVVDKLGSGFMSNASSSFFYAFICGGYFSFFLLILLNIHALYLMFIYLKNKIYKNNNNLVIKSTFLILVFLMIRSIFENSYSLFSLDYLLFVSSIVIFEKLLKNNKINSYKTSTLLA
jgi:hypothetical protein